MVRFMGENEVSYATATWKKIKKFHKGLKELENVVPMSEAREYILTGKKKEGISDEVYEQIEELQELRKEGIQFEMVCAEAQAKKRGIRLKEDILTGDDLRPGFSKNILSKVPSLGVYTQFMWYTEKELEQMRKDALKPNSLKLEHIQVEKEAIKQDDKSVEDDGYPDL